RTGICTIIDTGSLEIEVDVNEAYIQRVTPGQRVSAILDAYPGRRIPAEVIAIVPTADRQKATVRVRIGFLERDERILRDMGVKVAFLGSESEEEPSREIQGALVSGDSIRADEDGDYVWLVRDGAVEKRRISLGGPRDRPQVLVSQGLSIGDTVVRSSESPLGTGQTVKTKE
ncbi:MAG: efflux RND transporter periplasmic adaptor subunit, partial [Gammaproteobacteria bacterium]|nr:efflux RND transporter periplasmic adaptor subunit [Gammaproteobacteria bacterium]